MTDKDTRKPGLKTDPNRSRPQIKNRDRLLRQINRTRIPMTGWSAFLLTLEDIPVDSRGFESFLITASEIFDNLDEAFAAIIRWQAVLHTIEKEVLTGWYRKTNDEDDETWEVRGQIMQAAASVHIIIDDMQRPCFDKDELLKEAFRLGK